jgi:Holliday junction resolvasome RuvABC endonuclease subunit
MILALDPGTANLGWAIVSSLGSVRSLGVVSQRPDPKLGKSTDRATRVRVQARLIRDLVREHGVTAIAAEAASFNPRRFTMAVGLCMSIGALTGAAAALDLVLYELPPKRWQHAVLDRAPGARGKVDYDDVFRRLASFVGAGQAGHQLLAIPRSLRNHALDAVGIGIFTALQPDQATRIGP